MMFENHEVNLHNHTSYCRHGSGNGSRQQYIRPYSCHNLQIYKESSGKANFTLRSYYYILAPMLVSSASGAWGGLWPISADAI